MYIEQLTLSHYRNYIKQTLQFSSGINIFLGENAQGKTNLVESIYALAMTKSHRTMTDKELIHWDNDFSRLEAFVLKKNHSVSLKLIFHAKGKKASIDQLEQKKLSHYVGQLNVVLFSPEDLDLIKGSPQKRRKFLDMEIGQIDGVYLKHLSEYRRLLKQRNTYLKGSHIDENYLDILTEQLAQQAAYILVYRLNFIKRIEQYATRINANISQNKDVLSMAYQSQLQELAPDKELVLQQYLTLYRQNRQKELAQRLTLYGPHRDDILFYINNRLVQQYGSQGQQRTTVLSLKLAEIDLINEIKGEYPVLLLDDVLSELDDSRQTYLLKSIEDKVQTFITTTNIKGIKESIIKNPKIFKVRKGSVDDNE